MNSLLQKNKLQQQIRQQALSFTLTASNALMRFCFMFFYLFNTVLNSQLISESKITKCTNTVKQTVNFNNSTNSNSTSLITDLACKQKIVLALSIKNGQLEDTESIEAYVNEVTTDSGETKKLVNPFRINIFKSEVVANYPCTYIQDVNYRAYEQVIQSDVFSCVDGSMAQNPTCGWMITQDKKIIPYSQGFCCECNSEQIIGIDTTTSTRGQKCQTLNLGIGSASAHCLRFDPLWYSVYEIKKYTIDYQIGVVVSYANNSQTSLSANNNNLTNDNVNISSYNNIQIKNGSTNSIRIEKLLLSPSNTISVTNNSDVKASLIGDFLPPTLPNDYTSKYLLIPTAPATDKNGHTRNIKLDGFPSKLHNSRWLRM